MSTKTTFKRVALVAVAALGLGVLSVAPSSATVSGLTVTVANGTSTNSSEGFVSDSTTAAAITVSALLDDARDSITVTFVPKSVPAGSAATVRLYYMDTTTPTSGSIVETVTAATGAVSGAGQAASSYLSASDSAVGVVSGGNLMRLRHASTGYAGAAFEIQLDSQTTRIAGTYTYTVVVKTFNASASTTNIAAATSTHDVSIVVPTAATASTTVTPASTTAYINAGSYTTASDSAVAVVATAADTTHATIRVVTKNAAGSSAAESITATLTGPGLICFSTTCGKSLVVAGTGSTDLTIRADGTAGTATINLKTTTVTFSPKSVTFYAKSPKTITAAVNKAVIGTGTTNNSDVILATAVDANGNAWTGSLFVLASSAADALIAGSATAPVACTYTASISAHVCPVSGTLDGTAKFKVLDKSLDTDATWAAADAAATSNEVSVRVSTAAAASVKLAFDKATYGPGEQAQVWAIVTDAAGLALPERTIADLFTSSGIVSTVALGAVSTTTTLADTSWTVKGATSTTDPKNPTNAGAVTFLVTMPQASGDVTVSATGSTGLAPAGRVKVSATASVVNASVDAATDAANEATDAANAATDAALAAADAADAATAAAQDASDAVAALSATVAKLVASLKAQITSLTNLVIKIQKKVKA